ncbi:unnamed protein product [Owenia fusiformis]|uniref:Shugoshin C-terminal domain-containing protein n=1 Tax=Owenia fusiformis TaxID=6347 RepID=A0A8S4P6T0_OWEFU|nr:unnamed protein product [Owenia fusiformis]
MEDGELFSVEDSPPETSNEREDPFKKARSKLKYVGKGKGKLNVSIGRMKMKTPAKGKRHGKIGSANSSVVKQSLKANNRQLARALECVKQELQIVTKRELALKHAHQEQMVKINSLQHVAGLRNDGVEKEVQVRIKKRMADVQNILSKVTSNLLETVTHLGEALNMCSDPRPHSVGTACDTTIDSTLNTSAFNTSMPKRSIFYTGSDSAKSRNPNTLSSLSSAISKVAMNLETAIGGVHDAPKHVDEMSLIPESSLFMDDVPLPFTDDENSEQLILGKISEGPELSKRSRSKSRNSELLGRIISPDEDKDHKAETVDKEPKRRTLRGRSKNRKSSNIQTKERPKSISPQSDMETDSQSKTTETINNDGKNLQHTRSKSRRGTLKDTDPVKPTAVSAEIEKETTIDRRGTYFVPMNDVETTPPLTSPPKVNPGERRGTYFVPQPMTRDLDVENIFDQDDSILVNSMDGLDKTRSSYEPITSDIGNETIHDDITMDFTAVLPVNNIIMAPPTTSSVTSADSANNIDLSEDPNKQYPSANQIVASFNKKQQQNSEFIGNTGSSLGLKRFTFNKDISDPDDSKSISDASDVDKDVMTEKVKTNVALQLKRPGQMVFKAGRKDIRENSTESRLPQLCRARSKSKNHSRSKSRSKKRLLDLPQNGDPPSLFDFESPSTSDKPPSKNVYDMSLNESNQAPLPTLSQFREKLQSQVEPTENFDIKEDESEAKTTGTKSRSRTKSKKPTTEEAETEPDDDFVSEKPKVKNRTRTRTSRKTLELVDKNKDASAEEDETAKHTDGDVKDEMEKKPRTRTRTLRKTIDIPQPKGDVEDEKSSTELEATVEPIVEKKSRTRTRTLRKTMEIPKDVDTGANKDVEAEKVTSDTELEPPVERKSRSRTKTNRKTIDIQPSGNDNNENNEEKSENPTVECQAEEPLNKRKSRARTRTKTSRKTIEVQQERKNESETNGDVVEKVLETKSKSKEAKEFESNDEELNTVIEPTAKSVSKLRRAKNPKNKETEMEEDSEEVIEKEVIKKSSHKASNKKDDKPEIEANKKTDRSRTKSKRKIMLDSESDTITDETKQSNDIHPNIVEEFLNKEDTKPDDLAGNGGPTPAEDVTVLPEPKAKSVKKIKKKDVDVNEPSQLTEPPVEKTTNNHFVPKERKDSNNVSVLEVFKRRLTLMKMGKKVDDKKKRPISHLFEDSSIELEPKRPRRAAGAAVSYKEPSLNQKMRRGDPIAKTIYKDEPLEIYKHKDLQGKPRKSMPKRDALETLTNTIDT